MTEFFKGGQNVLPRPIEPREIAAALEAICNSDDFKRSSRLTDLLRYIVTEEVEDRGHRLKAYSIATEVLGRKADFDPSSDSIVRVEMARLRIALKLYYAAVEAPARRDRRAEGALSPRFARAQEVPADPPRPAERSAALATGFMAEEKPALGSALLVWRRGVSLSCCSPPSSWRSA